MTAVCRVAPISRAPPNTAASAFARIPADAAAVTIFATRSAEIPYWANQLLTSFEYGGFIVG